MLNKIEISEHKSLKERFPDYPQLPNFIRKNVENYNEGLAESCIRGFLSRVANWKKKELETLY